MRSLTLAYQNDIKYPYNEKPASWADEFYYYFNTIKSRRLLRIKVKIKIYSINFSHAYDYYNIENKKATGKF